MPPVGGSSPEVGKILLHFPLQLQKSDSAASIPTPKSRSLSAALQCAKSSRGQREGVNSGEQCLEIRHRLRQRVHFCPNLYVSFRPVARGAFENCPIGAWYSRSRPCQKRGSHGFNSRGRGLFQKSPKTRIFRPKIAPGGEKRARTVHFPGRRAGRILQPWIFYTKGSCQPGFPNLEGAQHGTPGNTDLS